MIQIVMLEGVLNAARSIFQLSSVPVEDMNWSHACTFQDYVNVNVNICNALEFPKEQKCGYLLWSIEAKMVQVCFELRSE